MNRKDEQAGEVGDHELDLLVDGELPPAAQRELLTRLEHQPDGWRRCAAAFLESQAWKAEFGALVRPAVEQPVAAAPSRRSQRSARKETWRTVLAAAASFVVALGIGLWGRGTWSPSDNPFTLPGGGSRGTEQNVVGSTVQTTGLAPDEIAPGWRMVTVENRDGQRGNEVLRVPAREGNQLDEAWLHSLPGPLSPDLVRALQRTGHSVQQSRQLLPMPLEDGRRLVVPVDQVDVHYVGNAAYQ